MDMRDFDGHEFGGDEDITVTAARAPAQRDPLPHDTPGYEPAQPRRDNLRSNDS